MSLEQFLKDELIKVHVKCENQDEVFELLYQEAFERGYVDEAYLEKVKAREAVFPTGLCMNHYNVAIPHTDPEFVFEQFIAVATLENPVPFYRMDDSSAQVNVNVVFMLGLNEPHNQLTVLQQIMGVIQDDNKIEEILKSSSSEAIRAIFS
ncbi:PTS sugar transporter subunit IIA [Neobacillus sp. LXY-4]|uniref:PTS sugar transporter subunit IIA n=1 Tax=Neobacillus sp. LXY-4 TaxID=3379826 RepID=UPI003EE0679A